jgi:RsiW-degrading membrane proteinase PrsW (M82 family)
MKTISRRIATVRLFNPRNLGWWAWMVPSLAGLVVFGVMLSPAFGRYPMTAVTGVALSVPYLLLWWFALHAMQIVTRIGTSGQIAAIVWGGGAAVGVYALPANGAIMEFLGQAFGVNFSNDWGAAIAAPLTEETGKALGVIAVMIAAKSWLRTPMDGLIIGGFVGLGFTLSENFLYGFNITSMNFGENPAVSTLVVYLLRAGLFFPISHVIFTALAGAGLGYLMGRPVSRNGWWAALCLFAAYGLHFLWNSPLLGNWILRFAVVGAVPLITWMFVHFARRAEHRWYLSAIAVEVQRGSVPAAYAGVVGGTLIKRLRYRSAVGRTYGPMGRTFQRELEGLLVDLADASDAGDEADAQRLRQLLAHRLQPQVAPQVQAQPPTTTP